MKNVPLQVSEVTGGCEDEKLQRGGGQAGWMRQNFLSLREPVVSMPMFSFALMLRGFSTKKNSLVFRGCRFYTFLYLKMPRCIKNI